MKTCRAKSQPAKPQGQQSSFAVIGSCLPVLRELHKQIKKRIRLAERIEIKAAARRDNATALRYEHHQDALVHVLEMVRSEMEIAKARQPEDNAASEPCAKRIGSDGLFERPAPDSK